MSEKERNLRVAEAICKEFKWSGQTLQQGDLVALLDGEVIAVVGNPDETIAALRAVEPDPKRGMVVEVAPPVVDVIR